MSRSDDIRAALLQSGEPMFPREIADAMGAEDRRERSSIAAQVSEMANQRQGVEKMDDGRYSLVPGWAKGRRAEKPAQPPVADPGPERPSVVAARTAVAQAEADLAESQLRKMTHTEISADSITPEMWGALHDSAGTSTTGTVLEVPPAGTATGTVAASNKVAERILEYLRGEADYNLLQLLRDAREEIMQLDCATRLALSTAEDLAAKLRATTA